MFRAISALPFLAVSAAPFAAYLNAQTVPRNPGERLQVEAELLPATSSHFVAFRLSQPGHVAIFAVLGGEAELVFPWRSGQLSMLPPGTHSSITSGVRLRTSASARQTAVAGAEQAPIAYLLIASERPLDVAAMVADPLYLRRELADLGPALDDEREIMSYLTGLVLPMSTPDEEWTTDVLYDWSGATRSYAAHEPNYATHRGAFSSVQTVHMVWLFPTKFLIGHHGRACPPAGRERVASRCRRPAREARIRPPRRRGPADQSATERQGQVRIVRPPGRPTPSGSDVTVSGEVPKRDGQEGRARVASPARQQSSPRPSASPTRQPSLRTSPSQARQPSLRTSTSPARQSSPRTSASPAAAIGRSTVSVPSARATTSRLRQTPARRP